MNSRWLVSMFGAALGVSCSDPTTTPLTQLNLDRPVDIAFACYGDMRVITDDPNGKESDSVISTAQPAVSCETQSPQVAPNQAIPPLQGQGSLGASTVRVPNWFGFILQSASGTVALATWASKPSYDPAGLTQFEGGDVAVLDADPLTPGKNAISVGEDPVAIATDTSGCFELTANAGSCDLSVLDINSVIEHSVVSMNAATPVRVERRNVTNGTNVPILAKPAAMVAAPNTKVVGNMCPMTAAGLVYIAYPSCHLVAAVDASSGKIVSGIDYSSGMPQLLANPDTVTCPAECSSGTGKLGEVMPGVRPVALDLKVAVNLETNPHGSTTRLVIGTDKSPQITVVALDPTTSLPVMQAPASFALEDKTGTLGVSTVVLSPQIAMGGTTGNNDNAGMPPGGYGQYVYAVASDHTVRVVDVLHVNKECDTQVDTRFVRGIPGDATSVITKMQCFPVGDTATPSRRTGARGPGIELNDDSVPTSVAIIKGLDGPLTTTTVTTSDPTGGDTEGTTIAPTPSTLIGYFAIITASNGRTYVVNIDDDNGPDKFDKTDPQATAPTLVMAHQLRDSLSARGAIDEIPNAEDPTRRGQQLCLPADPDVSLGSAGAGGPRAVATPVDNVVAGAPVSTVKVPELPSLRKILCTTDAEGDAAGGVAISDLQFGAPVDVRDQSFPDLRSLTSDETWSLTWEGVLSLDSTITSVDGPQTRSGQMTVDSKGMHLTEPTRPFCAMGVEPFDLVTFRGCNPMNGDGDCPSGYQCFVHPDSKVAIGACMLRSEASRLANACRDFLISLRHYTVGATKSGELSLLPRRHELRTTPLDGCTSTMQCQQLADYAVQNASDNLIDIDPNGMDKNKDPHTWECMADPDRKPINVDPAKNLRCVQTCGYYPDLKDRDRDCDTNMVCQGATAPPMPGVPGGRGVCMEGVIPPQACVNGPQRFDVRASEAFTVIGSRSGYIHPIIDQGGTCGPDPMASPVLRGRIPLTAPQCGDPLTTDPITGKLAVGGFEANPCSMTVQQTDLEKSYPNLGCGANCDPCANSTEVLTQRDAPAIKFRNPGMKLTLVDPYYPGDKTCVRDRQRVAVDGQPALRIPLAFPGYALTFEQRAGFSPLVLPAITPAFPVKVVRGPTDSIWVLDNGDFLSTTTDPSTRGRVFRIESTQLSIISVLN